MASALDDAPSESATSNTKEQFSATPKDENDRTQQQMSFGLILSQNIIGERNALIGTVLVATTMTMLGRLRDAIE